MLTKFWHKHKNCGNVTVFYCGVYSEILLIFPFILWHNIFFREVFWNLNTKIICSSNSLLSYSQRDLFCLGICMWERQVHPREMEVRWCRRLLWRVGWKELPHTRGFCLQHSGVYVCQQKRLHPYDLAVWWRSRLSRWIGWIKL